MDSLVSAVQKKQIKLVRSMLRDGANPDSTNQDGKCLLSLAIRNHDLNMVKLLLEFKANSNYIEPISEISVLQYALLECFDEVIELLIENGAKINYVTFYGLTSLHLAIERKEEKMVLLLLKLGADPNLKQPRILPLTFAANRFTQAVAGIQLSRGFNANGRIDYASPVIFEVTKSKLRYRMARYFLHGDASAADGGWAGLPALQFAASLGCPNLVKLLLDQGALVGQRYETDSECVNPLYAALANSADATACLLIERGADVDSRNQQGRSPLHLAAYYGCPKAAELLINRGVSVDVEDCEKITPLHMAVESNRPVMVDLLISHRANVNACSRAELYTSLHYAVVNDNRKIALRLLRLGASAMITRPDQAKQRTALEVAVVRGRDLRLIEILLTHVLERESQVDRRDTFAHLVRLNGWQLLAKLIVSFLARLDEGIQHDFFLRTKIEHFESFYKMCVDELTDMKTFVVYKNLTLHEIFARRGWVRVSLMRNKMLLNVLENCDYKAKYPIYEGMLKEHLNEAKTLLEQQYLNLQIALVEDFIPHYRLETVPHITETILDFMTKDEINKLHSLMHAD